MKIVFHSGICIVVFLCGAVETTAQDGGRPLPSDDPEPQIANLIIDIEAAFRAGQITKVGIKGALVSKLNAALSSLRRDDREAVGGHLKSFANLLSAQEGKAIDARFASVLRQSALDLLDLFSPQDKDPCHAIKNTPGKTKLIFAIDDFSIVNELTEQEKKNISAAIKKRVKDATTNMLVVEKKPTSEMLILSRALTIGTKKESKSSGDRTNSATLSWVAKIKGVPEPFDKKCCHSARPDGKFLVSLAWIVGRLRKKQLGESIASVTMGTPQKPISSTLTFTADRARCQPVAVTLVEKMEVHLTITFSQADKGRFPVVTKAGSLSFGTFLDGVPQNPVPPEDLSGIKGRLTGIRRIEHELSASAEFLHLTTLKADHFARVDAIAEKRSGSSGLVKVLLSKFQLNDAQGGKNDGKKLLK